MSSTVQRGDVVIVDFMPTNPNAKIRPALVVQNDRDNQRMANTIVAQVTGNVRRAHEATQLLIDADHPDWTASGLKIDSAVNCSNLATIGNGDIVRVIGSLSDQTMEQIEECLKIALAIQ